jgi:hypothetical protein
MDDKPVSPFIEILLDKINRLTKEIQEDIEKTKELVEALR